MAAIPATYNCVAIDYYGRTIAGPFKLVGELMYSDRGVGGGPLPPEGGGGSPPGIWPGPGDPDFPGGGKPPSIWPGRPEHPIVLPPNKPDVPPPTIWPPGPGIDTPEHPIVLPPDNPVIPPGTLVTWKAVWVPPEVTGGDGSWMVVGVPNVPHPSPS